MKSKLVKLSYRITLSNETEAKVLDLEQQYKNYFAELSYLCRSRGITESTTISSSLLSYVEDGLKKAFLNELKGYIKRTKPFKDVNGFHAFEIEDVEMQLTSFNLLSEQLQITIFCITTEVRLIDKFANFVLVLADNDRADWQRVLTIELSRSTTIHAFKNDLG